MNGVAMSKANTTQLDARGRRHGNQKPGFSHASTASTARRALRARWNDMKPLIEVVPAQ